MESYETVIPTRGSVTELDEPAGEMTVSYLEGSSFVEVTINGQTVHLDRQGIIEAVFALSKVGTTL